jgi:NhaP-type Na+/H+ or K+/H+ antiporter
MVITVALIAVVAFFGFGLPLGAAILLGGILAPTDPVLAADVQVLDANDRDRLRFCLTSEGGLNDGAAFPVVMLGMGLLGLHDLGTGLSRWLAVDVIWAVVGGLLIGSSLGSLIGRLVVYLRSRHKESFGFDEFLALGLIALAYGVAVLSYASGFLAVFAAGLALQRVKERPGPASANTPLETGLQSPEANQALATHSEFASAYMMQEVQGFNAQLERIVEMGVVLVVGAMLAFTYLPDGIIWFVPVLFLVIRPLSVWVGLRGAPVLTEQHRLIAWFGIRGIGSIYYLMYAINHGLPSNMAAQITAITLSVVTASIVLHGVSVTPLMKLYSLHKSGRRPHGETK